MVKNPHGSAYRRFCILALAFLSILHLGGESASKVYNAFTLRCISAQANDNCQGLRI